MAVCKQMASNEAGRPLFLQSQFPIALFRSTFGRGYTAAGCEAFSSNGAENTHIARREPRRHAS